MCFLSSQIRLVTLIIRSVLMKQGTPQKTGKCTRDRKLHVGTALVCSECTQGRLRYSPQFYLFWHLPSKACFSRDPGPSHWANLGTCSPELAFLSHPNMHILSLGFHPSLSNTCNWKEKEETVSERNTRDKNVKICPASESTYRLCFPDCSEQPSSNCHQQ